MYKATGGEGAPEGGAPTEGESGGGDADDVIDAEYEDA